MPRSVTLPEVLDAHAQAQMDNTHISLPCKVISYDSDTQTVAVQVLVQRPGRDEDGDQAYEQFPTYPSCPVAWPKAGSYTVYFPIAAGTLGYLIFVDISPSEAWSTGQVSRPTDTSRHDGGYAWFFPGGFPGRLSDAPSDAGYVGIDGGSAQIGFKSGEIKLGKTATDSVVLAQALQTALVSAVTAAVVVPLDGGLSLKSTLLVQLSSPGFLTAIQSALVKSL